MVGYIENNLEDNILEILYENAKDSPNQEMTGQEILAFLGNQYSLSEDRLSTKMLEYLKSLAEQKFIELSSTGTGNILLAKLTGRGERAVGGMNNRKDREFKRPSKSHVMGEQSKILLDGSDTANSSDKNLAYPRNIDDLAKDNLDCINIIQRQNETNRLYWFCMDRLTNSHVVLYHGLPGIGKTTIVKNLAETQDLSILPLYTTLQGCEKDNLDSFLFYLMDQIWLESTRRVNINTTFNPLEPLDEDRFRSGDGRKAFLEYWNKLIESNRDSQLVLILDEIDDIIDESNYNDDIIVFLTDLIKNNKNVYFILVTQESALPIIEVAFREFISFCTILQVKSYPLGTFSKLLALLNNYDVLSENVRSNALMMFDENPYTIRRVINNVIDASRRGQKFDVDLLDSIVDSLVEEINPHFVAIYRDLTESERDLIWALSRYRSEHNNYYSVGSLPQLLGNAGIVVRSIDTVNEGYQRLLNRGWVDQLRDGEEKFSFKFTIFLQWLRTKYISRDEVLK